MKALVCAVFGVALAAQSLPAHATASASFQGSCNTTRTCTFDAGRPSPGSTCSPSTIAEYAWNFGDFPSGTYFTAFPTISHTFSAGDSFTVTLTVYCSDGSKPTASHPVCLSGCITAGGGWQP
jgi:hypothetical protein